MKRETIKRSPKDKQNPYKMIRRATMEDHRLSFAARGVLGYLLVKPDDWQMEITDLQRQGNMGRDRTRNIIRELIETGYCERIVCRDNGRFIGYDYIIHEEPLPEPENPSPVENPPEPEKPASEKPTPENPHHTNKEVIAFTKEERLEEDREVSPPVVASPETKDEVDPFFEELSFSMGDKKFDRFLRSSKLLRVEEDVAFIQTKDNYAKDFIEQHLRNKIMWALKVKDVTCVVQSVSN